MQKTITTRINKRTGAVVVTTEGFTGSACQEATRGLLSQLGQVQSDVPTAESTLLPPAVVEQTIELTQEG